MPTARNMKELEGMLLAHIKKSLPDATKAYCHEWYRNASGIEEIVSEDEFIKMVNDSLKISMKNGSVQAELEIFKARKLEEDQAEKMKVLWEDFQKGYINYLGKKVFK